ncbi:MAG: phage holin family protein [Candidatus Adiutricales bacterium]
MNGLLFRWLISAVSLLIVSYIVPGIEVQGFFYALIAALFLGVLNAIVRPVLIILTLPLTILTLGLFLFVVNGIMLMLVSLVLKGFHVNGFWPAVLGALLLSVINWFSNSYINSKGRIESIDMHRDADGFWR